MSEPRPPGKQRRPPRRTKLDAGAPLEVRGRAVVLLRGDLVIATCSSAAVARRVAAALLAIAGIDPPSTAPGSVAAILARSDNLAAVVADVVDALEAGQPVTPARRGYLSNVLRRYFAARGLLPAAARS